MVVIVEFLSHVQLFFDPMEVLEKLRIELCKQTATTSSKELMLHIFLNAFFKNHVRVLPKYCISVLLLMCSEFFFGDFLSVLCISS